MLDSPFNAETAPDYVANVLEPLAQGEGVACFLADDDTGQRSVVFCTHRLGDTAQRIATDMRDRIRATQAVAIQHAARAQAETAGFRAVIG